MERYLSTKESLKCGLKTWLHTELASSLDEGSILSLPNMEKSFSPLDWFRVNRTAHIQGNIPFCLFSFKAF